MGILALQRGVTIHSRSPVIGLTGSEFSVFSLYSTYISVSYGTCVDFRPDET